MPENLVTLRNLTADGKMSGPEFSEVSGNSVSGKPFIANLCSVPHCSTGTLLCALCAKILQIMRNDFKDFARTFCQLCAPFSVQISINQERK